MSDRSFISCLLLAAIVSAVAFTAPHTLVAADGEKVVDAFLAACKENKDLSDEQRAQVAAKVAQLRQSQNAPSTVLSAALAEIHSDFRAAVTAVENDETDSAVEKLERLSTADDPFLVAESSFLLARAHVANQRFEDALPLLQAVTGKMKAQNVHDGESLFLRGLAESRLLRRPDASKTLSEFLRQFPRASRRMRDGALRELARIEQIEDGTLADIQQRMDLSGRRLSLKDSGKETRQTQDDIIAMLGKLIKDAEERESQAQASGGGSSSPSPGQQSGQSQDSGNSQGGPGGDGPGDDDPSPHKTVRQVRRGPRTPWGGLRDKEREARALAALKARFPARYQQLIKQYYRSSQDEAQE